MSIYDKASLVLIPSGTKTSKVYSQKPTNGDGDFTFSRSTAATRVNASGNIEKETQNLLLYSSTFSNANWVNVNTSVTGGQSGYDGTSNAYLLTKSAASARLHQLIDNDGVQTFSVYAKAGSLNYIMLNNSLVSQWYDLSNGTIGHNSSASNTIDAEIEDVGNGWYRCSLTFPSTIAIVRIYPSQADADVSGSTGNIYIQDAQLEQGLVARDYIETTTTAIYGGITDNVPRLDYQGSCPALLLEPQRTNLVPHSEYFKGGSWTLGSGTLTDNTSDTLSPEGLYNAVKLDNTTYPSLYYSGISVSASTQYTFSFYAKKGTITTPKLAVYDESNGAFISKDVAYTIGTDEWTRIEHTFTTPSGCTTARVYPLRGAATGSAYLFGAQLELGSYATSYIPTYGSSVTRANDFFETNHIQTNGLITSTQGSFFIETRDVDESSIQLDLRAINNNNNSLRLRIRTTSILVYEKASGTQTLIRTISGLSEGIKKVALAWNGTDLTTSVNGTAYTDTISSSVASAINEIGRANLSSTMLEVNSILLFPTQLSQADLNDLTTL